jgi:preprotein translocase subunit YajC
MSNEENTKQNITTVQTTDTQVLPQAADGLQNTWTSLVPMVLIFVVFYFLLIRPQDKKRKAQEELVNSVKKGEKVLLTSGIYGVVESINDSDGTALVNVADGVTIKILKTAIADIINRTATATETKDAKPTDKDVKKTTKKPAAKTK